MGTSLAVACCLFLGSVADARDDYAAVTDSALLAPVILAPAPVLPAPAPVLPAPAPVLPAPDPALAAPAPVLPASATALPAPDPVLPAPDPVLPAPTPISPAPLLGPARLNEPRILGVIPDYQTVTETGSRAVPLTAGQKWQLAIKETIDPFNVANAALAAGISQVGNQTPKYGEGGRAYGERFGAALADFGAQNLFSAGLLASVLHQDPRYLRKGPGASVPARILYSLSRIVVARRDSGRASFNASGVFGMAMGIAASNFYYPSASVRASVMAGRVETCLLGGVTGNLMSEFWPDIQKKFFHRKHVN